MISKDFRTEVDFAWHETCDSGAIDTLSSKTWLGSTPEVWRSKFHSNSMDTVHGYQYSEEKHPAKRSNLQNKRIHDGGTSTENAWQQRPSCKSGIITGVSFYQDFFKLRKYFCVRSFLAWKYDRCASFPDEKRARGFGFPFENQRNDLLDTILVCMTNQPIEIAVKQAIQSW